MAETSGVLPVLPTNRGRAMAFGQRWLLPETGQQLALMNWVFQVPVVLAATLPALLAVRWTGGEVTAGSVAAVVPGLLTFATTIVATHAYLRRRTLRPEGGRVLLMMMTAWIAAAAAVLSELATASGKMTVSRPGGPPIDSLRWLYHLGWAGRDVLAAWLTVLLLRTPDVHVEASADDGATGIRYAPATTPAPAAKVLLAYALIAGADALHKLVYGAECWIVWRTTPWDPERVAIIAAALPCLFVAARATSSWRSWSANRLTMWAGVAAAILSGGARAFHDLQYAVNRPGAYSLATALAGLGSLAVQVWFPIAMMWVFRPAWRPALAGEP